MSGSESAHSVIECGYATEDDGSRRPLTEKERKIFDKALAKSFQQTVEALKEQKK
jgi:hypothetical protein